MLLGNVEFQHRHAAQLNTHANASCESFMKTLKREEIYANDYRDLEHLLSNIEVFIEQYYNRLPLTFGAGLSTAGGVRAGSESRDKFCWSDNEFFQAWGDLSVRCRKQQ